MSTLFKEVASPLEGVFSAMPEDSFVHTTLDPELLDVELFTRIGSLPLSPLAEYYSDGGNLDRDKLAAIIWQKFSPGWIRIDAALKVEYDILITSSVKETRKASKGGKDSRLIQGQDEKHLLTTTTDTGGETSTKSGKIKEGTEREITHGKTLTDAGWRTNSSTEDGETSLAKSGHIRQGGSLTTVQKGSETDSRTVTGDRTVTDKYDERGNTILTHSGKELRKGHETLTRSGSESQTRTVTGDLVVTDNTHRHGNETTTRTGSETHSGTDTTTQSGSEKQKDWLIGNGITEVDSIDRGDETLKYAGKEHKKGEDEVTASSYSTAQSGKWGMSTGVPPGAVPALTQSSGLDGAGSTPTEIQSTQGGNGQTTEYRSYTEFEERNDKTEFRKGNKTTTTTKPGQEKWSESTFEERKSELQHGKKLTYNDLKDNLHADIHSDVTTTTNDDRTIKDKTTFEERKDRNDIDVATEYLNRQEDTAHKKGHTTTQTDADRRTIADTRSFTGRETEERDTRHTQYDNYKETTDHGKTVTDAFSQNLTSTTSGTDEENQTRTTEFENYEEGRSQNLQRQVGEGGHTTTYREDGIEYGSWTHEEFTSEGSSPLRTYQALIQEELELRTQNLIDIMLKDAQSVLVRSVWPTRKRGFSW